MGQDLGLFTRLIRRSPRFPIHFVPPSINQQQQTRRDEKKRDKQKKQVQFTLGGQGEKKQQTRLDHAPFNSN